LTLVFALALALVLAGMGAFLYLRLASTLSAALDQGLRTRAADLVALVRQSDSGLRESGQPWQEGTVAQVLDARGRIVDATAEAPRQPLLDVRARAAALHGARLIDRPNERLLALPVRAQDQRLLVIVGASTEARDEALASLRRELCLGGPAMLLAVSLLAYALARASLRPVEEMRRRAAAIGGEHPGERLPIPRARDEVAVLGETLNQMLARLELALERERRFVTDASHELRTPLTLLKGEIELALEDRQTSGDPRAALRSAGEETDRLVRLAEDLLLLARADRGSLPLRKEHLDVDRLLAGIAARFELRARERDRRIAVEPSGLTVEADQLRLEQALSNLVDNALRHGTGIIQLQAGAIDDAVELHVTDQGEGFPEPFVGQAFEPFARGRGTGGDGSGLGLAIVAAVARAHDGTANIRTLERGGADAWIALPQPKPNLNRDPDGLALPGALQRGVDAHSPS
jgi:two-component system, OmpR family, sensor kinase